MEYEQDENSDNDSFLNRIKESPRTVSALIIIIIVAAAIYAFSGDQGQPEGDVPTDEQAATTGETPAADTATGDVDTTATPEATTAAAPEPVSPDKLAEESRTLPEASRTDQGYVEVAEPGNGVTHLARRATTRFLSENTVDYAITNEHRIYIEDYIKDQAGSKPLALGESQTVSYELIREAVAAAKQLNEKQLKNLSQYTHVLT